MESWTCTNCPERSRTTTKSWSCAAPSAKHTSSRPRTSPTLSPTTKSLSWWTKSSTRYSCMIKTIFLKSSSRTISFMRLLRSVYRRILCILELRSPSIRSCRKRLFASCARIMWLRSIVRLRIRIFVSVVIIPIIIIGWDISIGGLRFRKSPRLPGIARCIPPLSWSCFVPSVIGRCVLIVRLRGIIVRESSWCIHWLESRKGTLKQGKCSRKLMFILTRRESI